MPDIDPREMDRLVGQACSEVDKLCTPELMTKEQAVDFLEDVVATLEQSLDALRDELADEDDEGEDEKEEEGR